MAVWSTSVLFQNYLFNIQWTTSITSSTHFQTRPAAAQEPPTDRPPASAEAWAEVGGGDGAGERDGDDGSRKVDGEVGQGEDGALK